MYYVRYPLSFRQVEDVLYERGIDIWVLSDQLDVPLVGT